MTKISLHRGDNRDSLRRLIEQGVRVHSVVTDPPYGLVSIQKRFGKEGSAPAKFGTDGAFARASKGFMGSIWDGTGIERDPEFWALIYEILLPGGYVFAFSGSRTGHWQACAMEMAGFVMHPMHGWVFGCLDTETLAATPDGDKPYTELSAGDEVICYDPSTGEYSVQPILEVVEYDYSDTAYRLVGNHGEQVVSRNHRCIVERDGSEVFHFAETLEQQEVIPILEDLRGLREALRLQGSESDTKPSVLKSLQGCSALAGSRPHAPSAGSTQGTDDRLSGLLGGGMETGRLVAEDNRNAVLQPILSGEGNLTEAACPALSQGPGRLDEGQLGLVSLENVRLEQPGLEGRRNAPQQEGQSRPTGDQVCALSTASEQHVSQRRLCDGASDRGGESDGKAAAALGGGASHQPRRDGQQDHQPDAVRDQCGTQTVRAWAGHKSDLVRVVPFHYVGKVWCLRVPTGSFVAVRNGVAFPTGNSGFPKAHAADKAIDKHLGVEGQKGSGSVRNSMAGDFTGGEYHDYVPGSPEAAEWEGWAYGTQAQKPALENIYLGQKPIDNVDIFLRLVHNALQSVLESQLCQQKVCGTALLSSVSIAEVITTLKNHGLLEANIAQNLARLRLAPGNMDPIGAVENISALTDTLLSELAINTSSNTALSWLALLVATWSLGNTFTTAITSEMITDLKTWNSLIGRNIRENTTLLSELTGSGSAVAIAEKCLKRACARLLSQISAIATESAIEQLALLETDQEAGKKPALEPIYLGQKPFSEKTGAANLLKHGVGAVNIDATRVPLNGSARSGGIMGDSEPRGAWEATKEGRHPSNLILDGSPEVVAMFPTSSVTGKRSAKSKAATVAGTNWLMDNHESTEYTDSGSAARFFHQFGPDADPLFYHSKAGKSDRAGSKHPTVKPIALMQYLIRHITPPGGVILDPFAGSGTTAEAAKREGFDCILMEAESEYIEFLESRFNLRRSTDLTDLLS